MRTEASDRSHAPRVGALANKFRSGLTALILAAVLGLAPAARAADSAGAIPHLEKKGTATQLIVDGQPFLCISGELHNSSASSREYMKPIWDKLVAMKLNSVIGTLSWELIEPEEGKFDFSSIDEVITDARDHNIRLVLIWFATWKNANNDYVPFWVKTNEERFPRAMNARGQYVNTMCALGEETMKADARAFAAVMKHIKEFDGDRHTVITIQVENETGILGQARDFSPMANEAIKKQVPARLIDFLKGLKSKNALVEEFRQIWSQTNFRETGTWSEVFGKDADEMFMAWNIGNYVNAVTAAGKAQYPIPMYANAWLNYEGNGQRAGQYPSGGPVAKSINIWQAAAPALDFIAPDLYARGFKLVAHDFTQSGNPLFIPETNGGNIAGPQAVYAFAEHDAMCFSPFAIENYQPNTPTTIIYDALNNMMPLIARYQGTGKMAGFYQLNTSETRERIELGNYRLNITYGGNTGGRGGRGGMGGFGGNTGGPGAGVAQALGAGAAPGAAAVPGAGRGAGGAAVTSGTAAGGRGGRGARGAGGFGGGNQDIACFGLAIAMGPDDFLLFGSGYSVQFEALNPPSDKPNVDLASVDEGKVVDGQWVRGRRLNGDEHQRGINIRRMVSPSAAADMAATAGPGMGMGMRGFAPTTTPSFLRVRVYNRK